MKRAEKIINCSKYWFSEDQKNRTAVVILVDKKESDVWVYSEGVTRKISHLIKEFGHDIYTAACFYAHKHITAEECKEPKGGER